MKTQNVSGDLGGYDPVQWEPIKQNVKHPADRGGIGFGVLIRNRHTGIYCLALAGAIRSVPQRWAAEQAASTVE